MTIALVGLFVARTAIVAIDPRHGGNWCIAVRICVVEAGCGQPPVAAEIERGYSDRRPASFDGKHFLGDLAVNS